MGQKVVELARKDPRFQVTAGIMREGPARGYPIPILPHRQLAEVLKGADVLIEFTNPGATLAHLQDCAGTKVAAVIGTTGFSESERKRLESCAKKTAIFLSPNMSPGMNVLFRLAREAAHALKGYDIHIVEAHHKLKKDAPSGTALRLADAVAEGGAPMPRISSVRAGDIVGDHMLVIAGPFERLELTHRAHAREVFAAGALQAAAWVAGKKPGLYGFEDLLTG